MPRCVRLWSRIALWEATATIELFEFCTQARNQGLGKKKTWCKTSLSETRPSPALESVHLRELTTEVVDRAPSGSSQCVRVWIKRTGPRRRETPQQPEPGVDSTSEQRARSGQVRSASPRLTPGAAWQCMLAWQRRVTSMQAQFPSPTQICRLPQARVKGAGDIMMAGCVGCAFHSQG